MNTLEKTVELDEVTDMAPGLTPHDSRGFLNNLESLGVDAEHEAAWAAEIERHVKEIENGEVELIDADVVFREANEHLAQMRERDLRRMI